MNLKNVLLKRVKTTISKMAFGFLLKPIISSGAIVVNLDAGIALMGLIKRGKVRRVNLANSEPSPLLDGNPY
tara:strand:+ start:25744 stop:25959 length:216 start_codon:yes stop_codon:yes gene_type:complete